MANVSIDKRMEWNGIVGASRVRGQSRLEPLDLVPVFGLYSQTSLACPPLSNWSRQIMTIDWISTLQEQAEFANQIAEDVKQTLEIPDLSVAQATQALPRRRARRTDV